MLKNLLSGGRDAIPIMVAYLMIGIVAGVFGVSKGVSSAEVALLSLLLFAGSAQFVFPKLYGGSPHALVHFLPAAIRYDGKVAAKRGWISSACWTDAFRFSRPG